MKKILNRKKIIKYIAFIIISFVPVIGCYFNSDLYQIPVAKVTKAIELENQVQQTKNQERNFNKVQELELEIQNDTSNNLRKNKIITIKNYFEEEKVYGQEYHKGDFLFVEETAKGITITGQKRDYLVCILAIILIDLLILIGNKKGILTIVGLIINSLLFFGAVKLFGMGENILWGVVILMIIFTFGILTMVNGLTKETLAASIATLATVASLGVMSFVVILVAPKIKFEFLDYLPEPYTLSQANSLLLSEILIGALGAVMDIGVTIIAATKEIVEKNTNITKTDLLNSVGRISDDITGLMINVVFFTNIAQLLPIIVLSMKNDFSLWTVLDNHGFFPMIRFLIGGIGIVAAIPLSTLIGKLFFQRGDAK